MKHSYVGIISRTGLELFLPENEHLLRFLERRAYRNRPTNSICIWAVVTDSVGYIIRDLLESGLTAEAFTLLQTMADDWGTICPQQTEPVTICYS
ncbi:MAG: hypothetical protein KDA65_16345 [Planctomycetaceae bacterium]|nr:hypothetical protein [Planctomycetaceae bacterium]